MPEHVPDQLTVDMIIQSFVPYVLRGASFEPELKTHFSVRERRQIYGSLPDQLQNLTISETRVRYSRIARWVGNRNMNWYAVHITDQLEPSENRSYYLNPDSVDVVRGDGSSERILVGPMSEDEEYLLRNAMWRFFIADQNSGPPKIGQ